MNDTAKSFSGKCPQCGSYHSRIHTELINFANSVPGKAGADPAIASRTRVFTCNGCAHIWSETVSAGSKDGSTNVRREWHRP